MSISPPDLENASAQAVVAYAVERFHPRLTMACSFQKEESALVHMLLAVEPEARVFTIDTGVLFPETLSTWRAFEERFGSTIEVQDAITEGAPWTATRCCVEAWITGIRREQAPSRAAARKLERDERRGIWKVNPLVDWTEKELWRYIHEHDLPYHPLHDQGYASIGCAPCTEPGGGREGRWAGQDKSECGIHV